MDQLNSKAPAPLVLLGWSVLAAMSQECSTHEVANLGAAMNQGGLHSVVLMMGPRHEMASLCSNSWVPLMPQGFGEVGLAHVPLDCLSLGLAALMPALRPVPAAAGQHVGLAHVPLDCLSLGLVALLSEVVAKWLLQE